MSYRIKLNYQGGRQNHIGNPLNKLNECTEYATREDACDAIYSALEDVIDGETGCEMVKQPDPTLGMIYICSREGINAEPINPNDEPYTRDEALFVDLGDPGVYLRETTVADGLDARVDYVAVNAEGEIVGYYQFREDEYWLDRYCSACHNYILREGYASEDGVTATIEEDLDQ